MRYFKVVAALCAPLLGFGLLGLTGCSAASATTQRAAGPTAQQRTGTAKRVRRAGTSPISHIIIIIQENHSFDNLFQGYPGANTQSYGLDSKGKTLTLKQVELGSGVDLGHLYQDFVWNYDNGKMDGFDENTRHGGAKKYAYTYIDPADIGPYLQMANQYVLNDDYFTSHLDASFAAHQMLFAAEADHAIDLPTEAWGCKQPASEVATISGTAYSRVIGPDERPCFGNTYDPNSYQTLADLLEANFLTWRWYSPAQGNSGYYWLAPQAVAHIFSGPDWKNGDIVHPETQILTDIPNGQLANVTWVTPTFANSDHGGSNSLTGPSWVASIVNAVGESPFWDSTAIFVTWDEWGGLYDHVPPPQLYYDGLGIRVPLLCISPYALAGSVNHTQLEAASVVRFAEDTFGLGQLTAPDGTLVRDSFATSAATGCLDFSQAPRAFTPIGGSYSRSFFIHQRPVPPSSAEGDADGD